MFFFSLGEKMSEVNRVGEWKETFPEIKRSVESHEFSNLVNNIVKDIGVQTVIDLGCGDGKLCQIFSKNAYLGLDIDENIINSAKRSFLDYSFSVPGDDIYSADMCIASRVFQEMLDSKIHDALKRMRCRWLLVAEPLSAQSNGNVYSFNQRSREDYVSMMRAHDFLLFKHMIKTLPKANGEDVSLLLFKKCGRNPIA